MDVFLMENPIKIYRWFGWKTHYFRKHPYNDVFEAILPGLNQIPKDFSLRGCRIFLTVDCWWFRNPAFTSCLVNYPVIYKILFIPGGAGFLNHQQYECLWKNPYEFSVLLKAEGKKIDDHALQKRSWALPTLPCQTPKASSWHRLWSMLNQMSQVPVRFTHKNHTVMVTMKVELCFRRMSVSLLILGRRCSGSILKFESSGRRKIV